MFSESHSGSFSEQNHRSHTQAVLRKSSRLGSSKLQRGRGGGGKRGRGEDEGMFCCRSFDLKDIGMNLRIVDSNSVDWSSDFQRNIINQNSDSDKEQFSHLLEEAFQDGERGREEEVVFKGRDKVGMSILHQNIDTFSDMDDDIDKEEDDNKVEKEADGQNITDEMTKKIKNTFGKQEISKVRVKKIDEVMVIDSFSFSDHEKILNSSLRRTQNKQETEEPSSPAPQGMREKVEKEANQRLATGRKNEYYLT